MTAESRRIAAQEVVLEVAFLFSHIVTELAGTGKKFFVFGHGRLLFVGGK